MPNFRSTYLQKIGFQGVELRRSLQALLDNDTDQVDVQRLAEFCERVGCSSAVSDREIVWKYLLGVSPSRKDALEYCWTQHVEHFHDLWSAVSTMYPNLLQNIRPVCERPRAIPAEPPASGSTADGAVVTSLPGAPASIDATVDMFLRMYHLFQTPRLSKRSDKENAVLRIRCQRFRQCVTTNTVDWFWLFAYYSRRFERLHMDNENRYWKILTSLLHTEDKQLHDAIAMLGHGHQKRLATAWFVEAYQRVFPRSMDAAVLDLLVADTNGATFCALALGIMVTFKLEVSKFADDADALTLFLCEPPAVVVEQQWDRLWKQTLILKKRYFAILSAVTSEAL
eukprot:m.210120 g.210120  ORF g.210120 m.210120 type:complete len:340 (+) comp18999_c0_seq5:207-1226(+)